MNKWLFPVRSRIDSHAFGLSRQRAGGGGGAQTFIGANRIAFSRSTVLLHDAVQKKPSVCQTKEFSLTTKDTMNDNQNHRVREGWTSSRVIAEPGGGGSLMLGMAPPPRKVEAGKKNSVLALVSLPRATDRHLSIPLTVESL